MSIRDRVPNKLRIGHLVYAVEWDDEYSRSEGTRGRTLYRSARFVLDPRQPDTEVADTVLHEALHALAMTFHIEALGSSAKDSEVEIQRLTHALLTFLRANPSIISVLLDDGASS